MKLSQPVNLHVSPDIAQSFSKLVIRRRSNIELDEAALANPESVVVIVDERLIWAKGCIQGTQPNNASIIRMAALPKAYLMRAKKTRSWKPECCPRNAWNIEV
jgi:hypothetical protein